MTDKPYTTPLHLTTPLMTGQRVKDAQWLLAGHNRFAGLATYKDGAIDGVYGPLTAQATKQAKYWLGYPPNTIDQSFGQILYEYLLKGDVRELPDAYLQRRKQRLAAPTVPGVAALKHAITQIGTKESPPDSNMQKYGSWYGMNGVPWCCIFVSWCFAQSAWNSFRYSYVPAVHSDALMVRNRLRVVRTVAAGDLALYNWGEGPDAHIEFFESWLKQGKTFGAVGGNTGATNFSNGGEVMRSQRYVSNVDAFVRVG